MSVLKFKEDIGTKNFYVHSIFIVLLNTKARKLLTILKISVLNIRHTTLNLSQLHYNMADQVVLAVVRRGPLVLLGVTV